jgi:hypothetical protein
VPIGSVVRFSFSRRFLELSFSGARLIVRDPQRDADLLLVVFSCSACCLLISSSNTQVRENSVISVMLRHLSQMSDWLAERLSESAVPLIFLPLGERVCLKAGRRRRSRGYFGYRTAPRSAAVLSPVLFFLAAPTFDCVASVRRSRLHCGASSMPLRRVVPPR